MHGQNVRNVKGVAVLITNHDPLMTFKHFTENHTHLH